jgi:hypothetical protein
VYGSEPVKESLRTLVYDKSKCDAEKWRGYEEGLLRKLPQAIIVLSDSEVDKNRRPLPK